MTSFRIVGTFRTFYNSERWNWTKHIFVMLRKIFRTDERLIGLLTIFDMIKTTILDILLTLHLYTCFIRYKNNVRGK